MSDDISIIPIWWIVSNKKLIDSNVQDSLQLITLSDLLSHNGAKLVGGKRLGRSIWQETIQFPKL